MLCARTEEEEEQQHLDASFFCDDDLLYACRAKKRRGLDPGVGDFFRFLFLCASFLISQHADGF
jgi:hypothetical protein